MSDLLVMMEIAGCRAAFYASDVQSVIELNVIHPVPRTPAFVVGLTALRSRSLTVVDARLAIGVSAEEPCGERAAVVEVAGHLYAIQVDAILDVTAARSQPTAIAGGFGVAWENTAQGMVETDLGPAILLDLETLVRGPALTAA